MLDQPGWGCWLKHGNVGQPLWRQGPVTQPQEAGLNCGPSLLPQTIPAILWLVAARDPLLLERTWLALHS